MQGSGDRVLIVQVAFVRRAFLHRPARCISYAMRRPDRTELGTAIFLFLVLAPLAYFTVRGLFAVVG